MTRIRRQGMCTTYLGAVLARRLIREHMRVREARLVRLNPNVTWKTRGNAAIMLDVEGDARGVCHRMHDWWRSFPISPARIPIPASWSLTESPIRRFTTGKRSRISATIEEAVSHSLNRVPVTGATRTGVA
jgi:tRNA(Ile2) C34 agmatinyltransferase TiaS